MKLLTFRTDVGLRLGVKADARVVDVAAARQSLGITDEVPQTVEEVLEGGRRALDALGSVVEAAMKTEGAWLLPEEGLQLGPCVPNRGKIICVGLNYRKHAEETKMTAPQTPILFSKFSNALSAHGSEIPLPSDGEQFDYEAELAVVIGTTARNVTRETALSYVAGYANANDFSCRDLQFRTNQWLLGKSYDGWSPVGPYLVTSDEVADPNALSISCHVNGERRQHSNTADMIFACDELVAYASRYMTLDPGDIILTGTPQGVAMGLAHKPWLKPGDEIVIEVEGLGTLRNVVGTRR